MDKNKNNAVYSERTILGTNRKVITIEEQNTFCVLHRSHGYDSSVSGPFNTDDKRFSSPTQRK